MVNHPNRGKKANPAHKAHFSFGVTCRCSCGWASATWYGKGAQANAAGDWRGHVEKCEAVRAEAA